ncbi:hypothetical protein ZIOFF_013474 [Zingiber officinale]|uniref:non-specific serine/threonine protein kinase n=1 Tax=Zingiber officinale TaxID=94328 RepID=A0A8J5HRZ0_ZINOF|nr:hypothetical protein ZIOFF_013474 [Zingiber officinale]
MGSCFGCAGQPKTEVKDSFRPPSGDDGETLIIHCFLFHVSTFCNSYFHLLINATVVDFVGDKSRSSSSLKSKKGASVNEKQEMSSSGSGCIAAQTFTFQELATATKNFRADCLLGEGGFGRVYKGRLEISNQIVAIKQLNRNGMQGNREFLVEVLMLGLLHHPNLVNLIGYCAEGDQRLLVYEYMPLGSLEDHLHDLSPDKKWLDWNTRMKIAAGAAKGLEYLHDKANPPVIYRDFKCPNILLDEGYHPKLSDFGFAKLGPVGDDTHVSTRVMGTYGYCAPEYAMTGQLTLKSDIYSFGVVLLELITGRKAIDNSRTAAEHNLVAWVRTSECSCFQRPFLFPSLTIAFPINTFSSISQV